MPDRVEFVASKKIFFIKLLLGLVLFTIVGVFGCWMNKSGFFGGRLLLVILAGVTSVISLVGLVVLTISYFLKKSWNLVLDPQGIFFEHWGERLAWEDIISFQSMTIVGEKFLNIQLRDLEKYPKKLGSKPTIYLSLYGKQTEEMTTTIVNYWRSQVKPVELVRITDPNIPEMPSIIDLYVTAFPENERRSVAELKESIQRKESLFFNLIYVAGDLVGFTIYWDFKSFFYLEHFAIFPSYRGQGYGEMTINLWHKLFEKRPAILEAEPADSSEIAARRIAFYERNGFQIVSKDYGQASYGKPGAELPLWLLCSQAVTEEQVEQMVKMIKAEVYYAFYSATIDKK